MATLSPSIRASRSWTAAVVDALPSMPRSSGSPWCTAREVDTLPSRRVAVERFTPSTRAPAVQLRRTTPGGSGVVGYIATKQMSPLSLSPLFLHASLPPPSPPSLSPQSHPFSDSLSLLLPSPLSPHSPPPPRRRSLTLPSLPSDLPAFLFFPVESRHDLPRSVLKSALTES